MRRFLLTAAVVASWTATGCGDAGIPTGGSAPYLIDVSVGGGEGSGVVLSDPPGINCRVFFGRGGGSCQAYFPPQSSVILKARADSGSAFVGWTDGSTVVATEASLTVSASRNRGLGPYFAPKAPFLYTVRGTVSDSVTGAVVPGATVIVGGRSARSDSVGSYVVDSLTTGMYTVSATSTRHHPFQAYLGLCCGHTPTTYSVRLVRRAPWLIALSMDTTVRWGWPFGQTRVTWAIAKGEFSNSWLDWTDAQGRPGSAGSYQYETVAPGTRTYLYHAIPGATKIIARMAGMDGPEARYTCLPAWICRED